MLNENLDLYPYMPYTWYKKQLPQVSFYTLSNIFISCSLTIEHSNSVYKKIREICLLKLVENEMKWH